MLLFGDLIFSLFLDFSFKLGIVDVGLCGESSELLERLAFVVSLCAGYFVGFFEVFFIRFLSVVRIYGKFS